jgi:outer membrane protein insertion porin family
MGLELRDAELAAATGASEQLSDWIANHGNASSSGNVVSTAVTDVDYLLRWRYDTRNRPLSIGAVPGRAVGGFPEQGLEQTLGFRAALPGGDLEYYLTDYEVARHWPLGERWTVSLRGRLGYGAAYGGETSSLPPYLNWLAGGPRSVRGYRENGLGPRDTLGNPYGGNLFLAAQFEVMTPWPERWRERTRAGVFYDIGNVFSTEDVAFADESGRPLDYGFAWSELRQSVGLAVHLLIPLGVLRVSYAVPLNAMENGDGSFRRDDLERFQISIGMDF